MRAESAHAKGRGDGRFDEKDLKSVKLTTKDYIDHDKSKQNKKDGKYGVTVPKPFEFDMRDKVKPKTIREQKVGEMIAEKHREEQAAIKF